MSLALFRHARVGVRTTTTTTTATLSLKRGMVTTNKSPFLRPLARMTTTQKVARMVGGAGAATTMVIGGPLLFKQPVACQQMVQPTTPALVVQEQQQPKGSLIHKGEISFGVLLGVCTGYFLKKIGKLFAFMVGLGFVSLQYMSAKGYVTVHWDKISGSDRNIDVHSKWQTLVGFLTHNIQFKSTFMAGLYAGIRYG